VLVLEGEELKTKIINNRIAQKVVVAVRYHASENPD